MLRFPEERDVIVVMRFDLSVPLFFLRVIEWLRNYTGSSMEWAVTVTAAENLRWFSLCKTFYLQFKQTQLTRFVRNQI